jgi:uncharacterized phage protein gp47/JayE
MFEEMTFENIVADMLGRVTSDVDKREGSIIYDALAPCAYQLAQAYFNLNNFIDLVSGDTAIGEYLDRVVADYSITRKSATYAVRKIETSGAVSIGTRWGINGSSYAITALLSTNIYSATCEQLGDIGNQYSGAVDNIDNVSGITAALTDIITPGEEEETDDNLRTRFYTQIQSAGTSGNAYDYRNWALEVPGCGDAKVFPLWNGAGTVKVLVVDENMTIDVDLPEVVANYLETVRPIGATVTVVSPTSKEIGVTANVKLNGTKTLADIRTTFTAALTVYLKDAVFETYSVSYAKIGNLLLTTAGVEDYNTLLVNTGTANITILDTEMPFTGTVTLVEVT